MRKLIVYCTLIICCAASLQAQNHYKPFFRTDSLSKILPYFRPEIPVWPKSTGNVQFRKDTVYEPVLKVWIIESANYNEPIYGVYTDTANVVRESWVNAKNYVQGTEKYGPGKIFLFYYRDGTPLNRTDINDLRRYGEIPGIR